MNVYTAYQINLLDKSDYVLAHGLNTDDQLAVGIVYSSNQPTRRGVLL